MNTSTIEARRMPAKRLGIFALGIAVACAGMFGMAASKADAAATNQPINMQLQNGLMNLGFAFQDADILPAKSALKQAPTSPLPNWWDIVDSLVASGGATNCQNPANALFPCGGNPDYALIQATGAAGSIWNPSDGSITLGRVLPAGSSPSGTPLNLDVRFPIMAVVSPTSGDDVPITLAATGIVTGTFSNGELTLTPATGTLEARVLVGLGIQDPPGTAAPQPFTYCSVPLPSATLTTGTKSGDAAYSGTPFFGGLEGTGAFQSSFTVTANAQPVLQGAGPVADTNALPDGVAKTTLSAACPKTGTAADDQALVNAAIKGNGSVWLGNRVEVPKCGDDQIGTYPDCIDPKADITKIQVTGKKSVKKGKKVKLTVKVTNSGTADQSVKLRLWSSNGGVASVTGQTTVDAIAGGVSTKTVTVTAKKKKGKTTIHATNGAKTGKLSVKVK